MAPAKTKLQREQKLWELQRPPAGPIHTYKCLSKQSFNDGAFNEWVFSLTSKITIPPKRDWVGAEARGSSELFSERDLSPEENKYSI